MEQQPVSFTTEKLFLNFYATSKMIIIKSEKSIPVKKKMVFALKASNALVLSSDYCATRDHGKISARKVLSLVCTLLH